MGSNSIDVEFSGCFIRINDQELKTDNEKLLGNELSFEKEENGSVIGHL